MKTKQKREQRAKLVADARLLADAVPDGQAMSAEDSAKFDAMMEEADKIKVEIDRLERLDDLENGLRERVPHRAGREDSRSDDEKKAEAALNDRAYRHYLRYGMNSMPDDLRAIAMPRFSAAQGTVPDTAGGYLVPEGFYGQLIDAQLAFGGMLDPALVTVLETGTGNPLPIPTDNDTASIGAILGENTQAGETEVTFGNITLGAYTYTSKIVRVSNQLLQDSFFNLETFLAEKLGLRLARIFNTHLTSGDGANKPTGALTAATAATGAASQTVYTADELIDLAHSVDPSYRSNARYMMNDNTLKQIKKLKDLQGRYLWMSGLAFKEPDTINSYAYSINQQMPNQVAGARSLLFGQFKNYYVRRVTGVLVMRLVERYADFNQTAFVSFQRLDGNLIDAGTHPIKYMAMAA
ncbi:MAG TPA: phage major capsid protein [Reyranella sp.]|nr:phage major capsid protein [Reyranella sp.]HTE81992.1 phage major capsid protein [Reyranella sp.]